MNSEELPPITERNEKNYTMEFKRNAISFAEKNSNNAAAKKFSVERKGIREWRENKPKLFDSAVKASSKR